VRIAHPNRSKKLSRDILGLMDKSIILSHCEFSLTNLHSVESLHFVPTSNLLNFLISLYICSGNTQFTVVPPIFRIQNEVSILHTVYSRILSFMELWLVPT
jgi:hypothetical protein